MDLITQININETFRSPFSTGFGDKGVADVINLIVTGSLTFSGVVVLLMFVFAGYSLIAGAGQNNPEQVAKGKQAGTNALIGFIIVFGAYWIIRIIEVILGVDFITNPTI